MQITLEIPDELAAVLAGSGQNLSRAALEAIALEAYRQRRLSGYQLRTLLGIASRFELDGFLKEHKVYDYTIEDFEKDLATVRKCREEQKADKSA
ncbi:MAG: UPF0175 family protein [Candidatus Korobacteraceae bacterium]|jgi:hypothetical protein